MYMITNNRPLTVNDYEELVSLMKSRPYTFNGYTDKKLQDTINYNIEQEVYSWLNDPLYYIPAIFVDGKLFGAMICKEFENSPCWTWGYWVNYGNLPDVMSVEILKSFREWDRALFDEMEINRKLNRFFVCFRTADKDGLKSTGMSERLFQWMGRQNYRVARYKFITDCIIEADTLPKYEYQKNLLTNRSWPFDVAIRLGVLIE